MASRSPARSLVVWGGLVVVYSVIVLGYAATSPDLRLRGVILNEPFGSNSDHPGVIVEVAGGLECRGEVPQPGATLLEIRDQPVHHFLDFVHELKMIHTEDHPRPDFISPGILESGIDASQLSYLSGMVEEYESGRRWVRIRFQQPNEESAQSAWVLVQSIPFGELALSFIWFVMQLGIFVLAGLAYWHRSFDRSARLFFAMSIVTMGAYVGGYHWRLIAGNSALVVPFTICGTLVPAVTLHFFLVYPRPRALFDRYHPLLLIALYSLPGLSLIGFLGFTVFNKWLFQVQASPQVIISALQWLCWAIYAYLFVAAAYFGITLAVLLSSYRQTRNPVEQNQLKWILWAGMLALPFVGYSLYLAQMNPTEFALGKTAVPMFCASLFFMTAYAMSMLRHQLMFLDQIVSKGMLYYAVSACVTGGFAMMIVLGSLLSDRVSIKHRPLPLFAWGCILVLSVILLMWLRDLFQQLIDRRFFREKYQLGKALERMNQAVGHLAHPEGIGELMLSTCQDVLDVTHVALYLRVPHRKHYQLVSAQWSDDLPLQLTLDPEVITEFQNQITLQRVVTSTRSELSPSQNLLRELQAEVVQALEIEKEIEGLVVLGDKTNPGPFLAEDLTFLNAICQMTNVALHSAKVHQELSRLNEEMQLKADTIDEQKREISLLQSEIVNRQYSPEEKREEQPEVTFQRDLIRGHSPAITRVLETVRKVANSESTVLIRGESGTGKELMARVLHQNSVRIEKPMISVNCASLSSSLLESELFGHVKGAFTGATADKMGRFEAADGGTLFLDEIGDISLETQIKLLRVLQERCFEPVGGSKTVHVDVRLLTATHQNLEKLIAEGKFREDLFYRLNVISLTLPPLRERREDIIELAIFFLERAAKRLSRPVRRFDSEALEALENAQWRGNIRELENAIEHAVVLAETDRIRREDLPKSVIHHPASTEQSPEPQREFVRAPLVTRQENSQNSPLPGSQSEESQQDRFQSSGFQIVEPTQNSQSSFPHRTRKALRMAAEREQLENALRECEGNKAEAARMLGLPRSTYFSKLKKHGIIP